MRSFAYYAGVAVGILVVFVVFLVIRLLNKEKPQKCKFDERQLASRGDCYKYGFFTLMIYCALYALLDSAGLRWCETPVGIILGILLSVGVFAVTAVSKDAYFSLTDNRSYWIRLFTVVGIINIAAAVIQILLNGTNLISNSLLSTVSINIAVGLLFIVILIAMKLHNRAENAKEDQ